MGGMRRRRRKSSRRRIPNDSNSENNLPSAAFMRLVPLPDYCAGGVRWSYSEFGKFLRKRVAKVRLPVILSRQ